MATAGGAPPPAPRLEPIVELLLRKCGAHADLVIDCVITKAHHFHPAVKFAQQVSTEQLQLGRCLWGEPLLQLLQRRHPSCRCSPLGQLTVRSAVLSGSQMEGFGDVEATLLLHSDHDTMFELGPVQWTEEAGAGPGPSGPRLRAVPTANPGFVQLLQEPLPDCQHRQPLVFSAADVRELMHEQALVRIRPGDQLGASGPSTALTSASVARVAGSNDDDLVPCLRARWWPAAEFVERRRKTDWPPAAARDEIRRFGVHLVPVGCRDSATELTEWRLSFSRAEVVAAWHLTEKQRCSLLALKACKARLGPRGKGVKSYFMKTALYWLCQERPAGSWRSVTQGARYILDFLEEAVAAGRLPSFFWAEINLLRLATPEDREEMRCTIRLIRRDMSRLLLTACAELHMRTLGPVLEAPGEPLSEGQLRTCLARALVLEAAILSSTGGLAGAHHQASFLGTIPVLLRAGAAAELHRMHRLTAMLVGPQQLLLRALLVAPPEVAGRARLTPSAGGGFTWDAAPLLALLTADQWAMLLHRPAAVAAWCRQQRALPPAERPAGLPENLDTPRGRAELLLTPGLMERVLRATAPEFMAALERSAGTLRHLRKEQLPPFAVSMQEAADDYHSDLAGKLQRALRLEDEAAEQLAHTWRLELRRHWADPRLKTEYERIRNSVLDAWQLRLYARGNTN